MIVIDIALQYCNFPQLRHIDKKMEIIISAVLPNGENPAPALPDPPAPATEPHHEFDASDFRRGSVYCVKIPKGFLYYKLLCL